MFCSDCEKSIGTVHYVLGACRCQECADQFNEFNRKRRQWAELEPHRCESCFSIWTGSYGCPHCCQHEPDADEGYHCLNCGKDCSEDVMSAAYDRAKDIKKYGE